MDNESIILNAPEGATHTDDNFFYRLAKGELIALGVHANTWECYINNKWVRCDSVPVRSLSDVHRIAELESENSNLAVRCNKFNDQLNEALLDADKERLRAEATKNRIAEVEREMDELIIKNSSLKDDQSRLNYLDELNAEMNRRKGSNYGWRVDWNHNRVALNDTGIPKTNVRTAIDKHKALMSMQSRQQLNGEIK